MLLTILLLITLGVVAFLGYYLWFVPEGPACPRCGGPGRTVDPGAPDPEAPALLRWCTIEAWCGTCDWEGRFRRGTHSSLVWQEQSAGRRGR